MFQATRGMRGFIFQIEIDIAKPWQDNLDQMGIRGTIEVCCNKLHGPAHPLHIRNAAHMAQEFVQVVVMHAEIRG